MKLSKDTIQTMVNYGAVASNDETRPHLCSIALRLLSNDLLEITACDGYKLIKSSHKILDTQNDNIEKDKYFLIAKFDLKHIKEHLKENKDFNMFTFILNEESFTIEGRSTLNRPLVPRDYPRVDPLIPVRNKAPDQYETNNICFNIAYMNDLLKAVTPTKAKQSRVGGFNWILFAEKSALYCEKSFEGIDHILVLQPCIA